MPRYDYEVRCKDIRPDGSSELTLVVQGVADARTAREHVERRIGPRMARAGTLRGTLISFSAKRIPGSER